MSLGDGAIEFVVERDGSSEPEVDSSSIMEIKREGGASLRKQGEWSLPEIIFEIYIQENRRSLRSSAGRVSLIWRRQIRRCWMTYGLLKCSLGSEGAYG